MARAFWLWVVEGCDLEPFPCSYRVIVLISVGQNR